MSDWIGLGLIVLVVVLALVASARLGAPRGEISAEEFERRAREGAHTRAGMFALQEVLHPKAAKAVEIQQDLKAGYYNKRRVPGDGADDAPGGGGPQAARDGEGGAAAPPSAGSETRESAGRDA